MPLYEYECKKCQIRFEDLRPMNRRYSAPCPICGERAEQIIAASFLEWTSGRWIHDVTPEPVYCETKADYKRLLAENEMVEA